MALIRRAERRSPQPDRYDIVGVMTDTSLPRLGGRWAATAGNRRGGLFLEMPLREGAARSRLQIALEADRAWLVGEFDGDVQAPGTPLGRMGTETVVVGGKSCAYIGRQADVEMWLGIGILQDVDGLPLVAHASTERNSHAWADGQKCDRSLGWIAVLGVGPPSRLRRFGAASFASHSLAWFTEPKLAAGERRLVGRDGIEPSTL